MQLQVRQRVRQIDCVTVKGSNRPMGLFTYDVSLERVPTPDQGNAMGPLATRRDSLASSISTGRTLPELDSDVVSYSLSAYNWEYTDHPDLACTWAIDEAFLDLFARVSANQKTLWQRNNASLLSSRVPACMSLTICVQGMERVAFWSGAQGFAAYKSGDWEGARRILEQTKWIRQTALGQPLQDGPSTTLLDYMAHTDYVAPFTWKGYRELTEK